MRSYLEAEELFCMRLIDALNTTRRKAGKRRMWSLFSPPGFPSFFLCAPDGIRFGVRIFAGADRSALEVAFVNLWYWGRGNTWAVCDSESVRVQSLAEAVPAVRSMWKRVRGGNHV